MIIDTFMFLDELDMLEFRLAHMEGHDVRHVLVEATRTHRGHAKDLYYGALSEERFGRWRDRIVRVVCDHLPSYEAGCSPWVREHLQRDCARQAILALADGADDTVLISDVDEIPDMGQVGRLVLEMPVTLEQRIFAFAVDWEFPHLETTSVAAPASWLVGEQLSVTRDNRHLYPAIGNAGWHFSWLGGPDEIRRKVTVHCHEEYNQALFDGMRNKALYEQGIGVWGFNLKAVDVDGSWPAYIRERRCPGTWFRPRSS